MKLRMVFSTLPIESHNHPYPPFFCTHVHEHGSKLCLCIDR
jgi:hypothetical protein